MHASDWVRHRIAIQDQECQRVIRIIAMLSQQRPTQLALHRNQVKRGLTLVMLKPPRPAATEVAQTIKNSHSVLGFHSETWRSVRRRSGALDGNVAT